MPSERLDHNLSPAPLPGGTMTPRVEPGTQDGTSWVHMVCQECSAELYTLEVTTPLAAALPQCDADHAALVDLSAAYLLDQAVAAQQSAIATALDRHVKAHHL